MTVNDYFEIDMLLGVDAFFYFYFFDDLYYIEDIQQAFKNICLDKMLSDGYFDMSAYIFGRLKKEDIYARLVASKSRYAVLYRGRFPNKIRRLLFGVKKWGKDHTMMTPIDPGASLHI